MEQSDLLSLRKPQLVELCKQRSLPTSGRKEDLVQRLLTHVSPPTTADLAATAPPLEDSADAEVDMDAELDADIIRAEKRVRLLELKQREQELSVLQHPRDPPHSEPRPSEDIPPNQAALKDQPASGRPLDTLVRDALQQTMGLEELPPHSPAINSSMQQPAGVLVSHQYQTVGCRSNHLDICDFVQRSGALQEEDTILQTSGDRQQQLVLRSGSTKKVSLNSVSLREWNSANIKILTTLLRNGQLGTHETTDYLSYSQMILDLAADYDWLSVLQLDREYRILQHAHKFAWGTEAPRLYPRLQRPARVGGRPAQSSPSPLQQGPRSPVDTMPSRLKRMTDDGLEICMQFKAASTRPLADTSMSAASSAATAAIHAAQHTLSSLVPITLLKKTCNRSPGASASLETNASQ